MAVTRSLREIIEDTSLSDRGKALECLAALDGRALPFDDLARPDYRAAAIAFSSLALAQMIDDVSL